MFLLVISHGELEREARGQERVHEYVCMCACIWGGGGGGSVCESDREVKLCKAN